MLQDTSIVIETSSFQTFKCQTFKENATYSPLSTDIFGTSTQMYSFPQMSIGQPLKSTNVHKYLQNNLTSVLLPRGVFRTLSWVTSTNKCSETPMFSWLELRDYWKYWWLSNPWLINWRIKLSLSRLILGHIVLSFQKCR